MKKLTWWAGLPAMLLVGLTAYVVMAQEIEQEAILIVLVPPDSVVTIEGNKTQATGEYRRFRSPPLKPGKKYSYTVKATFTENGKPILREETVSVTPGAETVLDLRREKIAPPIVTKPAEVTKPVEPTKPVEVTKPATKPEVTKPVEPTKPATKPEVTKPVEPTKPATKPEVTKPATKPEVTKPVVTKPVVTKPEVKDLKPLEKVEKTVDELLKLGGVKKGDVVIDLGAGNGVLAYAAVANYKADKAWAVEPKEEKATEATKMVKDMEATGVVTVLKADPTTLKEDDLKKATVIFVRVGPEDTTKLIPTLKKLKPGTRIVVHDANLGEDWKDKETKSLGTDAEGFDHEAKLYEVPE